MRRIELPSANSIDVNHPEFKAWCQRGMKPDDRQWLAFLMVKAQHVGTYRDDKEFSRWQKAIVKFHTAAINFHQAQERMRQHDVAHIRSSIDIESLIFDIGILITENDPWLV